MIYYVCDILPRVQFILRATVNEKGCEFYENTGMKVTWIEERNHKETNKYIHVHKV